MSSKAAVLIRQWAENPPVVTAVTTSEQAEAYRKAAGIAESEFNPEGWMRSRLNDVKEEFCNKMIEFRRAEWTVEFVDLVS